MWLLYLYGMRKRSQFSPHPNKKSCELYMNIDMLKSYKLMFSSLLKLWVIEKLNQKRNEEERERERGGIKWEQRKLLHKRGLEQLPSANNKGKAQVVKNETFMKVASWMTVVVNATEKGRRRRWWWMTWKKERKE